MADNIAAFIEKEYGNIDFKSPVINFGYNVIELKERISLPEKILVFTSLAIFLGILSVINPPIMMALSVIIAVLLLLLYQYYPLFDRIIIDFTGKEIRLVLFCESP